MYYHSIVSSKHNRYNYTLYNCNNKNDVSRNNKYWNKLSKNKFNIIFEKKEEIIKNQEEIIKIQEEDNFEDIRKIITKFKIMYNDKLSVIYLQE